VTPVPFDSRHARASRSHSQRGQAALFVVLLLAVGIGLFAYGAVSSVSQSQQQDLKTRLALTQARDALIGRAASDASRPGSLPCPDTDDDGVAELFAGIDCPSYIGRLPWKTLGLPDPRDDAGERLWYALAPAFRDDSSAGLLDNDTKGGLTVYHDSTATVLTAEAVAVIFAPGPVVTGQIRDAANANNPANYLDTTGGVNNTIAAGPFISAQASSTFNDRLLAINTVDLIPTVERRVASTMLTLLQSYRAASTCACYPWAANNFDDDSVTGRTQGMVPIEVALPEPWGSGTIPNVPSWMIASNEWGKKFYYAIAPSESQDHTVGTITVDGASKNLVLITTGPAGASRPSTNLADYVDDAENRDGGTIYISPTSTAYARDRIYTIP
jgi:hypothetical protein